MKGSSTSNMLKVKSGPGYSMGKKPPAVTPGHAAHPKASSGSSKTKAVDPKSPAPMSGAKAGNHAIMRRPYK